ncbi:GntT/GntP/DsdX family permease, partial [Klebsiella pneumoniae]|uniref:GntT/GntP/DsdX family permease n=1 Tax=Klebsiella pneumoniae TaxID=573 RepID=UPI00403B3747
AGRGVVVPGADFARPGVLLTHTENGFGSIANILLIIGAGGAFNAILKSSGLADSLAVILSNLDMHPILLASRAQRLASALASLGLPPGARCA